MTDATELDEAAIRARLEAATEGPWEHVRVPFRDTAGHSIKRGQQVLALVGWEREEAERAPVDAEFIAHARTDVGLLLTALDEARAEAESESVTRINLANRVTGIQNALSDLRAGVDALAETGERDGRGNSLDLARRLRDLLAAVPQARDEARAKVERLHFDLDREARARQAAEQERDEARAEGAVAAINRYLADYANGTRGSIATLVSIEAALATPTTPEESNQAGHHLLAAECRRDNCAEVHYARQLPDPTTTTEGDRA